MRKILMAGLVVGAACHADHLRAQTVPTVGLGGEERPVEVTLRTGISTLNGGGELFRVFRDELGLAPSDFDSGTLLIELSTPVGARADLVVGGAIRRSNDLETRAWEGVAGTSGAGQSTRLTVRPTIHTAVRVFAASREATGATDRDHVLSANPYAVLGLGLGHYSLMQWGSFVDERIPERFSASFRSTGGFLRAFVGLGVRFAVTDQAGFVMEARRDFGSSSPNGDFSRFQTIDLSGSTLTIGVTLR